MEKIVKTFRKSCKGAVNVILRVLCQTELYLRILLILISFNKCADYNRLPRNHKKKNLRSPQTDKFLFILKKIQLINEYIPNYQNKQANNLSYVLHHCTHFILLKVQFYYRFYQK